MASIEIPEPLWQIHIRAEFDRDWRETLAYYAELRFGGITVYEQKYDKLNNVEVFENVESHGGGEDAIRDDFTAKCAYKIGRMFISFGGPI